jgi:hypothetical protein
MEWVAIYGAVIGSISAAMYLRNWWYDRPHIKVNVSYGMGTGSLTGMYLIILSAVNTGRQTVYINGAGFELQEHRSVLFTDSPQGVPQPKFPKELLPNNKFDVYFSLPELVKVLVEGNRGQLPLAAWFTDATDKYYKKAINPAIFSNWVKLASGTN